MARTVPEPQTELNLFTNFSFEIFSPPNECADVSYTAEQSNFS